MKRGPLTIVQRSGPTAPAWLNLRGFTSPRIAQSVKSSHFVGAAAIDCGEMQILHVRRRLDRPSEARGDATRV